jgi:hypothetical protein
MVSVSDPAVPLKVPLLDEAAAVIVSVPVVVEAGAV